MSARRARSKEGTELEEKLINQMDETPVKLGGYSGDYVRCAWRINAIKDIAYSGWKANGGIEESEKEKL